jgi:hypothetical protein
MMELPKLEHFHEKSRINATEVRDQFLATVDKITRWLTTETRAGFWSRLRCQLFPSIKEGVVKLTPTMLRWAGRMKTDFKNFDPTPKMGNATNGRIIRNVGGL